MSEAFVMILMGSDSDWPVMQATAETLKKLQIPYEVSISSAHRTPHETVQRVCEADKRGCQVFIACAGLAAHLAGTVAAHTCKPVIGVPMQAGPLQGFDALLSTVQMPGGVPVACVAIGKAGASNAAYLAAQMLALNNAALAQRLTQAREQKAAEIKEKNAALQAQQTDDISC